MLGIIKSYSFDEDYFRVGDAFQLHRNGDTNVYFYAILDKIVDNTLVFVTRSTNKYPDGIVKIKLGELTVCSSWEIVKLEPDYREGKFDSEE